MLELAAFLHARGFLIVARGPRELDVHLRNHVSDRYDRIQARAALELWRGSHPDVAVQEVA